MSNVVLRNRRVDLLKGICIIFVIVTHFAWEAAERKVYLFPFWIDMAVPVFMIISGYINASSFERRKISSLKEAYSWESILKKFIRYTLPFAIIYLIEVVFLFGEHVISGNALGHGWVILWVIGGYGPGGYYYPIMIQFIFLFPIIYFIVHKYGFAGVLICGGINGIYEVLKCCIGMSEDVYRVLVFRYILLVAFGCYFWLKKRNTKYDFALWLAGGLGIGFIIFVDYIGYVPKLLYYWTGTSFLASLYIVPLVGKFLSNSRFVSLHCEAVEQLGKASYHIFLVQMVYWYFLAGIVGRVINWRFVPLIVGVVFCIAAGWLFYKAESRLSARIIGYINKDRRAK